MYEVFPPEEAKRIADKIDMHFTPQARQLAQHRRNRPELLYRQCLDRRISIIQQLGKEVKAWLTERDQYPPIVNWRFNTKDARIKLKHLYPALLLG